MSLALLDQLVQVIKARALGEKRSDLTSAVVSIQGLREVLSGVPEEEGDEEDEKEEEDEEDTVSTNLLMLLETRFLVRGCEEDEEDVDLDTHIARRLAMRSAVVASPEFDLTIDLKDSLARHASIDAALAAAAHASNWRVCDTSRLFAYEAQQHQLFGLLSKEQLRLVRDYLLATFPGQAANLGVVTAGSAKATAAAARKSKRGSHVGSFNNEAYAAAASAMKPK